MVAALPNEIAVKLIDFFENVLGEEQYTSIKMRLLKKFTHTDLEKAEIIRSMPGIGDRKTSDLMDSMLAVSEQENENLGVSPSLPFNLKRSTLRYNYLFIKYIPNKLYIRIVHTL